jgi:molybdate transport system substrate-binding protein
MMHKETAKKNSRVIISIVIITLCSLIQTAVIAEEIITVAAAANFSEPLREIAFLFYQKTGIKTEPASSSSGKLYARIIEGAPYTIFLSADEQKPEDLYQRGISEKPFIHANGEVVLWSGNKDRCGSGDWKEVFTMKKTKKVAMANIEAAPYGTAAMTALQNAGILSIVKDKLVYARDISNAFHYAATQGADAALCEKSLAPTEQAKTGCCLLIKEAPPEPAALPRNSEKCLTI